MGTVLPAGRVTLVFTDVVGSVRLAQALGKRYLEHLLEPHRSRVRTILRRHDGHEIKTIGDSFMLAFQSAQDAISCCVAIQSDLSANPLTVQHGSQTYSLSVRIGAHTSITDVVPLNGDYDGNEPNLASRVESLATGGQILLSSTTKSTVEEGTYWYQEWPDRRIKGWDRPQSVWECLWDGTSRGEPGSCWYPDWFKGWSTPFVRRVHLETRILDLLGSRALDTFAPRVITILGAGGMGKTRLATSVAIQAAGLFRNGVCFISFLHTPPTVDSCLEQLRQFLSVATQGDVRARLSQSELLLVLDNYETAPNDSAAELLAEIVRAAPNVRVLLTSRAPTGMEGLEQIVQLTDGMTEDEAVRMLADHVSLRKEPGWKPSPAEESVLRAVATATERIPLALELAASWSRKRTLEEIVEMLAARPYQLEAPARTVGIPDRHRSLERCAASSVDLLTPAERDAFARLGVVERDADFRMISFVCNVDRESLDKLDDASLVIRHRDGTYGMHGFLRSYAASLLSESDRGATKARYVDYWLARAEETPSRRRTEISERMLSHAVTAAAMALDKEDFGAVNRLCKAFAAPLLQCGFAADSEALSGMSVEAAMKRGLPAARSWSHYAHAAALEWQGRMNEAEQSYRAAVQYAVPNHQRRISSLRLAEFLHDRGRTKEALGVARTVVDRAHTDADDLAMAFSMQASLLRRIGQFEEADYAVLQSAGLRTNDSSFAQDYYVQGRTLVTRDAALAAHFLERAVEIWKKEENDRGATLALTSLSEAYQLLARFDDAEASAKAAVEQSPNAQSKAYSLVRLARVHRGRGAVVEARGVIQQAAEVAEGVRDEPGVLSASLEKAAIERDAGNADEAIRLLGVIVSRSSDQPRLKAIALDRLGHLHLDEGRPADAEKSYRESLRMFEALQDQRQVGFVRHHLAQAEARARQKEKVSSPNNGNVTRYDWAARTVRSRVNRIEKNSGRPAIEPYVRTLLREAASIGDAIQHGVALNEWGSFLRQRGDFEEAKRALLQALAIFTDIEPERAGRAGTLHKLGDLFTDMKAWVEGEEAYRGSMMLKLSYRDQIGYAITLGGLGTLYIASGHLPEAEAIGDEALQICERLGTPRQLAAAREFLERVRTLRRQAGMSMPLNANV